METRRCFMSNCVEEECNQEWTEEEEKTLENALDFSSSPEMPVGDHSSGGSRKRSATDDMSFENKRKKVVHWTEAEHELFLEGLKECGKGDWKNIGRRFVVTKTPTQVASHAQKYYIRQKLLSEGGKDDTKKRSSIHDISLLDIMENTTPIEDKSLPLIQNVQPQWINVGHNNNQHTVFSPSNDYEVGGAQQQKTSIQNVQPKWINVGHNNNQHTVFNPSNGYEVGGAQQKKTNIQNVQPELINIGQHMVFNPSNSYEVGGAQQKKTSIQNMQPKWINVGHNNNQHTVFNPSNDYEVGGAQQKKTSIQNVQPKWINVGHNNNQHMGFNPSNGYEVGGAQQKKTSIQNNDSDQLIVFNPSNDEMSSQYHGVTGALDLFDIYLHFTSAKRQSS